jgi:hypothetical protein
MFSARTDMSQYPATRATSDAFCNVQFTVYMFTNFHGVFGHTQQTHTTTLHTITLSIHSAFTYKYRHPKLAPALLPNPG